MYWDSTKFLCKTHAVMGSKDIEWYTGTGYRNQLGTYPILVVACNCTSSKKLQSNTVG